MAGRPPHHFLHNSGRAAYAAAVTTRSLLLPLANVAATVRSQAGFVGNVITHPGARRSPLPSCDLTVAAWSLDIFRPSSNRTARADLLPSPGGRFENSPPFQGWDCRIGASRPEGTDEFLPQKGNRNRRMTFAGFSR